MRIEFPRAHRCQGPACPPAPRVAMLSGRVSVGPRPCSAQPWPRHTLHLTSGRTHDLPGSGTNAVPALLGQHRCIRKEKRSGEQKGCRPSTPGPTEDSSGLGPAAPPSHLGLGAQGCLPRLGGSCRVSSQGPAAHREQESDPRDGLRRHDGEAGTPPVVCVWRGDRSGPQGRGSVSGHV